MPSELSRREQNVIRRLLNRAEFRPLDVATLGYTRLSAAPGLGAKGLRNVIDWLKSEGFILEESAPATRPDPHARMHRRIESARHLLEQWGWQVRRPEAGCDHGPGDPADRVSRSLGDDHSPLR